MNTSQILSLLEEKAFIVQGLFLVLDLDNEEALYNQLSVAEHGMETVSNGQKTEAHVHNFLSFYKSHALNVEYDNTIIELPEYALVLVPEGIEHSWVPQAIEGEVGSVDSRHERQVILEVQAVVA